MSTTNLYHDTLHPQACPAQTPGLEQAEVGHAPAGPLVYLCSPAGGDSLAERARGYCRFAVSEGCVPVAPQLLFPQFMEDDGELQNLRLRFGLTLQNKCDAVWVFGRHTTEDMAVEIGHAWQCGLPVRYFTDRCVEVTGQ